MVVVCASGVIICRKNCTQFNAVFHNSIARKFYFSFSYHSTRLGQASDSLTTLNVSKSGCYFKMDPNKDPGIQ